MEALILLSFLGIIGLISSRRWRRLLIYPVMGVTLFFGLALSPPMIALAHWGLVFPLPSDLGETVDTIVVLGRGEELRQRRVEIVDELWKTKRSPTVFVSGMLDASGIVNQLKQNGLSSQVLGGENCSQTTEENAQFTSALLRPQKVQKLLLVTDAPHMLRSLLLFRSFGFTIVPHSSSLPPNWSAFEQMKFILREYAALASYALSGRFRERTIQELNHPASYVLERLSSWKCKI